MGRFKVISFWWIEWFVEWVQEFMHSVGDIFLHPFVQKLKVKLSMKNDFELSKCSPDGCEIIGWFLSFNRFSFIC